MLQCNFMLIFLLAILNYFHFLLNYEHKNVEIDQDCTFLF